MQRAPRTWGQWAPQATASRSAHRACPRDPGFSLHLHVAGTEPGAPAAWAGALTTAFHADSGAPTLLPYQFRMEEIEGFRYRCRVSRPGRGWGGAGRGGAAPAS